uniref:Phosphatidylinositol-glycan biosynthesis class W protein n=1 Tax=Meloidogyne enterolobii TaxID=390850 RepID=A0A6V7XZV2_MELEN|nr:unnamed protein product [Meloidogyne enterolobii]
MLNDLSLQTETALVFLNGLLTILLRNALVQLIYNGGGTTINQEDLKWHLFTLDFLTIVIPMFLIQTLLADYLFIILGIFIILILITLILNKSKVPSKRDRPHEESLTINSQNSKLQFCDLFNCCKLVRPDTCRAIYNSHTMFRALLLNTTALAILAVDFSIFPRRFAKTHYYGQSLMDTGTAAFVFVNALADESAEREGRKPRERALKSTMNLFFFRIPTLLVLALLGIGRSLFVHLSGYGQDVTEYGVHWNFFVTLFFIRMFVAIVPTHLIIFIGLLIGLIYQYLLTFAGLEGWLLKSEYGGRHGFVDQNREGIFSLFGYFFIYSASFLYAKCSAHFLEKEKRLSLARTLLLFLISISCYLLQYLLENYGLRLQASRRLANLTYCFAMLALFSASTTLLQIFQFIAPMPRSKGGLVEAISRNALLHFLIANLLTGFVNMFSDNILELKGIVTQSLILIIYSLNTSFLIYLIPIRRTSK